MKKGAVSAGCTRVGGIFSSKIFAFSKPCRFGHSVQRARRPDTARAVKDRVPTTAVFWKSAWAQAMVQPRRDQQAPGRSQPMPRAYRALWPGKAVFGGRARNLASAAVHAWARKGSCRCAAKGWQLCPQCLANTGQRVAAHAAGPFFGCLPHRCTALHLWFAVPALVACPGCTRRIGLRSVCAGGPEGLLERDYAGQALPWSAW